MPKKPAGEARKPKATWTTPRQFRLTDEDLSLADRIAAEMDSGQGGKHTRTDAIRWALRFLATHLDGADPTAKKGKK